MTEEPEDRGVLWTQHFEKDTVIQYQYCTCAEALIWVHLVFVFK